MTTKTTPDGAAPLSTPPAQDLALRQLMARMANGISPSSVAQAYGDWFSHFAALPSKHAELAASAMRKGLLWLQHGQHAWRGECLTCVEPPPCDKRFSAAQWQHAPWSALAQGFLLTQQWWDEAMTGVRGVSPHHEEVAAFTTRQWLDMLSPSNFIATNPQVLAATVATGGANLAGGMTNWWRDATGLLTHAPPRGVEDFKPGINVAVTPGQVVYSNHLIELIQYTPSTPRVDAEPVLMIPSWIMKYYILDLRREESLVKYMVEQGHTVFMVSWRNPGGEDRNLGLDDYVQQGVLAALAAVGTQVPGQKVHAMGYCLGGTLLAIAAAALARARQPPADTPALASLTLLAAQTDFQEPGELGLFIDESQIAFLEDLMAGPGYLDGRHMAGAFALINSRDLVWSRLVHEYMMGATTPMTALRAWNADATRLPARMHSEYLRGLYLRNDLAEGRFHVDGRRISLHHISVPLFVVATERDHVSPWQSVYKIHRLVNAPVSFVLASGGHNVGIVNPPGGPAASRQASYLVASHAAGEAPAGADEWKQGAQRHEGSWWPAWHAWLRGHSSGSAKARELPAAARGTAVIKAPGTYVHQT